MSNTSIALNAGGSSQRLLGGKIDDSPFRNTPYSPVELQECPEHDYDIDGEIFPDCPNCRRATIETNLSRAQVAVLNILMNEKMGLPVPDTWREDAGRVEFWQQQLDHLPTPPSESGPGLPGTVRPKTMYPN